MSWRAFRGLVASRRDQVERRNRDQYVARALRNTITLVRIANRGPPAVLVQSRTVTCSGKPFGRRCREMTQEGVADLAGRARLVESN